MYYVSGKNSVLALLALLFINRALIVARRRINWLLYCIEYGSSILNKVKANVENKAQIKVIFLCLKPLSLNTTIKLSNNKTKAVFLSRNKRPVLRLVLLVVVLLSLKYDEKWDNLDWTKKFLLLKIPTDPRYCEGLTGISKRKRPGKLLSRYKISNKQY